MPITNDQWKQLIETPAERSKARITATLNQEEQKRVALLLWKAIDEGDQSQLQKALDSGARVNHKRKGRTALWWAFHLGQWELVPTLLENGANIHAKSISGATMMSAISHRDRPDEADKLVAFGFGPQSAHHIDFFPDKPAPRLFEWWLENGHVEVLQDKDVDRRFILKMGVYGSPRMRAIINREWGVDATNPNDFSRHHNGYDLIRTWEDVFSKDDVELVRALLISGWCMPLIDPKRECPSTWLAAKKGAWDVFDWLCTNDAFKEALLKDASIHPGNTWWASANSVAAVEKFESLGVDITQQDTFSQANFAHHISQNQPIKKALVAWLHQRYPALFEVPDRRGKTAYDALPKTVIADIEAKLLKAETAHVRGPKAPTSRRL